MQAVAIIVAIYLITVECYMPSTKNEDVTTISPRENQPQNISEAKNEKREFFKTFNVTHSRVYLDDVLFALRNQNWTDEENPCLEKTMLLLRNLQNFTLWAVWEWDSISSQPQGLLFGSRYHLGNFDECMSAPWYNQHPELRTQYCLADIVLERTDNPVKKRIADPYDPYNSALNLLEYQSLFLRPLNQLTWGACVPAECQQKSVEKLMGTLLAHSHLGTAGLRARINVSDRCQTDKTRPYDGLFYAFIAVISSLSVLALICTFIKCISKDFDENKLKNKIISTFDLKENTLNLLHKTNDGIDVLYGLKFLTMCIVVVGHQFGIFNGGPVSNGSKVDEDALTVLGMLFLHDDIVVDSFFMISGFLAASTLTRLKKLPNFGFLLFKRYLRIASAFAVVIFYTVAVYPFTGTGPLWNRAVAADTDQCRKNWWISLLMLSNYIDSENICLVISWYVPCDYHFFVVTMLLYYMYRKFPRSSKLLVILVTIAAIVTPGVINYIHEMPAIQLFTYDFISNPRGPKQFHVTYIKSHTRYAAYLVGFFAGYLHVCCTVFNNVKKIPQIYAISGALLGLLMMAVILFTGSMFLGRPYDALESAIYAALNRPVWASSVALLVLCCSLGHIPILNSFLGWSVFVPLSRLAYGLYLTHTLFIARNVYVARNPPAADLMTLMTLSAGIIFEGCLAAYLIWLLVEAPINNLINLTFQKRINEMRNENIPETQNPSGGAVTRIGESSSGSHLSSNLPTSICIISSKI